MKTQEFQFEGGGGLPVFVRSWLPDGAPRAAIQIAHGMVEHSARYARVARALVEAGYAVYANDHRGHGETAKSGTLGDFGAGDGWNELVRDVTALGAEISRRHPDVPHLLFGHSMGSFATQQIMCEGAAGYAAIALSGSTSLAAEPALLELARAEAAKVEPGQASETLAALAFGSFNAAFPGARTEFDWLSRDPAEVDAYVDDPLCGFALAARSWVDLFAAAPRLARPDAFAAFPVDTPVYVFSGEDDPVHGQKAGWNALLERLRAAKLEHLETRLYPGGRHEMLNETNREEVTRDLLAWLDGALAQAAGA